MKALEAENKVTMLYITDPENEAKQLQKSTANNISASAVAAAMAAAAASTVPVSAPTTTASAVAAPTASSNNSNNLDAGNKARPQKRPLESDEPTASVENPNNTTIKRRQITEPKLSAHVACHNWGKPPGEELRFIPSKAERLERKKSITRQQLKHLARRPWERRVKSRV